MQAPQSLEKDCGAFTWSNILRVHDGLAWLSQIALFIMLGLLVTPSALFEVALASLGVALLLMLVARPLAVTISLLPFRFPFKEQIFISWTGLRDSEFPPVFLVNGSIRAAAPFPPAGPGEPGSPPSSVL